MRPARKRRARRDNSSMDFHRASHYSDRVLAMAKQEDNEKEMTELLAAGIARPPQTPRPLPKSFWSEPLPEANVDLLDILRRERDA